VNSPDTTINLANVFSTSSEDPITYSVDSQTNPSLVTATIEDSILTLSFAADQSGSDVITIRANVPTRTVTTDFEVTVNPVNAISSGGEVIPLKYSLSQNYPNPFNPETTISYALPKASDVVISIYDVNGRHVTDILNANRAAGYHNVKWNASDMASGIYFYQIKAGNFIQVKRCILIR
jgi:thiamine biosynthesis protein ThiC